MKLSLGTYQAFAITASDDSMDVSVKHDSPSYNIRDTRLTMVSPNWIFVALDEIIFSRRSRYQQGRDFLQYFTFLTQPRILSAQAL